MIFHLCAWEAQTSWDKQGGYAETHWSEGGGSAKIWTETQMSKHPYNHPKSQYHPPKYDDLRCFYNGNPLKPSAVWLIFEALWRLMSWLLRKSGDHWGMIPTRYRLQIEIDIDRHDISSMRCAKFQKDLFFGRFPSMKGDLHGFKFSPFATLILGMHVTGAKQPPRVANAFLFLSHKESISWTMTSTSKSATWCQCILAANRLVECSDERAKTKKKNEKNTSQNKSAQKPKTKTCEVSNVFFPWKRNLKLQKPDETCSGLKLRMVLNFKSSWCTRISWRRRRWSWRWGWRGWTWLVMLICCTGVITHCSQRAGKMKFQKCPKNACKANIQQKICFGDPC